MTGYFSLNKNIAILTGASIELALDERLKYNVLLPITIVIVAIGMMKNIILGLLGGDIVEQPRQKFTEIQTLQEINLFLTNGKLLLDEKSFEMKRLHYLNVLKEKKFFAEKADKEIKEEKKDDVDPAQEQFNNSLEEFQKNTGGIKQMAIGNALNFIPQTVITWWLNHFFTNYVIMRLPFPLTLKFKEVVQNGIQTRDLDASYTTTISWYFILMYGLDAFYNVFYYSRTKDINELNVLKMQTEMENQINNLNELQIVQQCEMLEKALEEDMVYDKSEAYGKQLEDEILEIYDETIDINI